MVAAHRAHARHGSCLRALPLDALASPEAPSTAPDLSLALSFLSLPCISPSPRARSAAVAAARRGHSHRLPLASPSCPGAPPRRQLPPRRATQAGVPRGAAIAVIFVVGRPRSSAPVRHLRLSPEQADQPIDLPVSFCFEPLSSPSRLRRLGLSSAMAEARLRSSLSPALLRRPFGHPVLCNMLAASHSASLALQFPCLHAAAHSPHMAELRPPPWSSPSSSPATVGPASTTTRHATARALQRAQERPRPCPVGVFRAAPPSRASPASSRR